ncbi:hypothetical protein [Paenibacillus cremeus]|uniref:Uncharacterized protein n=1 Tax=Paenibacillus cremeus TaxID=2163881 RepID=A0A559KFY7_9BACL|nr:hypothetical protein [Paenibacillus cremeus]TVY11036.1 hypothetical protein FPZ49_06080 [Paenibacillus cremeus]
MKFVTDTRLKQLEDLVQSIPDVKERAFALHLLNSIRSDIDDNYAEIQRPISLPGLSSKPRKRPN